MQPKSVETGRDSPQKETAIHKFLIFMALHLKASYIRTRQETETMVETQSRSYWIKESKATLEQLQQQESDAEKEWAMEVEPQILNISSWLNYSLFMQGTSSLP